MKEKDISDLVKRYREVCEFGRNIYFDAEEFENLADYYDLMDDINEAERVIQSGLQIHPGSDSLRLKQAKFMIYKGLYEEAMESLNEFLNIGYNYDLYLLKIECFLNLGLYIEAISLTQNIIELEEEDLDTMFSELGFLYLDTDYIHEAILYFKQSLSYKSDNLEVLSELAYAYEVISNFQAAIDISNRILDINPYSLETWVGLGKLYSLCGEYEKAVDSFDFALVISEDNDILKLKAHCLSLCEKTVEAISIFKSCIVNNPLDDTLYYAISECYFSLEDYDNMLIYLDKYQEMVGESIDTIIKRAIAYLQKQDMAKVSVLIERAIKIDSENEDLNLLSGEFYFQNENYTLSEHSFLKAYTTNKNNSSLLNRLTVINIAKGELNKAIEYLEVLDDLETNDSEIKNRLALLYLEVGDKESFNNCLNTIEDEQLRHLTTTFYKEAVNVDSMDRKALINRLNDACECRLLYKNIMY